MSKSAILTGVEVRAVYQLIGECRDLGDDPARWRLHLMAGLCRLIGAGVGNYYEGLWEPYRPRGVVTWGLENGFDSGAYLRMHEAFVRHGIKINPMVLPFLRALDQGAEPGLTREDLVSDAPWYRSPYYRDFHGPAGADAILYCSLPLADGSGQMGGMSLVRLIGEKDFSKKDRVLITEVHTLITPLIGGPLAAFGEPSPGELPRRQREVLRCLLQGDGDKQIATRLRLSRYTVNEYVKRIFRHFGVQTRPELLARWIRRGWGGRFAWADQDANGDSKATASISR